MWIHERHTCHAHSIVLLDNDIFTDLNASGLAKFANPVRFGSGRRDSNPRRPAWEAGILPLNYSRNFHKFNLCDPCVLCGYLYFSKLAFFRRRFNEDSLPDIHATRCVRRRHATEPIALRSLPPAQPTAAFSIPANAASRSGAQCLPSARYRDDAAPSTDKCRPSTVRSRSLAAALHALETQTHARVFAGSGLRRGSGPQADNNTRPSVALRRADASL